MLKLHTTHHTCKCTVIEWELASKTAYPNEPTRKIREFVWLDTYCGHLIWISFARQRR